MESPDRKARVITDMDNIAPGNGIYDVVEYFSQAHNLSLTPAGVWVLDDDGNKIAVDAKRIDNLSWGDHPEDNMARLYLNTDTRILVLDVDGHPVRLTQSLFLAESTDNIEVGRDLASLGTLSIQDLNLEIPYGMHTTTTRGNKYHFYYRITEEQQKHLANRIKGLYGKAIDVFTYGVVFEGHTFSQHHSVNRGVIPDLPDELYNSIIGYQNLKDISASPKSKELVLAPNILRFNLIKDFLDDKLTSNKDWNEFYRTIMPKEYLPKRVKKLSIDHFELSYDLFNKLAVKLATTSQISTYDHLIPTLRKLLLLWDINPDSRKSRQRFELILPSLPTHDSVLPYDINSDRYKDLQEFMTDQTGVDYPIFRVIHNSKIMYMEINARTLEPRVWQGSSFFDVKVAQALHPEREIVNQAGTVVGWDSNVPIIGHYTDPYKPAYMWDEDAEMPSVNLYIQPEYIKYVEPIEASQSNLIMRAVHSTIGPKWIDLYLAYSAYIVFGDASPSLVLWMAALRTELGGSGKSVVTLELFSKILGGAASAVILKTINSGWGDILTSTKILSLEDLPEMTTKEWEQVYANIKQQNTNSYRKLNMKGGAIVSDRVSIALTGSTNYRPKLSPSDRRFLCLEPAHFHGYAEPLSEVDRRALAELMNEHSYNHVVQEYTNHLYYVFTKGISKEFMDYLFVQAPDTEYRQKWVTAGSTNSQSMFLNLNKPDELLSLCKYDSLSEDMLIDLLSMVLLSYNTRTHKTALSWKWFECMLPYVMSDSYSDNTYSKTQISKMLNIDFKKISTANSNTWKRDLPSNLPELWKGWPTEGFIFTLTPDARDGYMAIIADYRDDEYSRILGMELNQQ